MKKIIPLKLFTIVLAALLMLTFAGTVFSKETKDNGLIKVAGIISDISPETGKVAVADGSGMAISLTASLDVELKDFKAGDNVVIEYDRLSGIIISMIKQDSEYKK